jgi:hypothetical protein
MRLRTTIFTIVIYWFSQRVAAVETHCATDELIVFNCSTGKKIVSVCASKTMSATSGYLQYRFGRKGSPELIYPEVKIPPKVDIQANTLTFAGGGGAYIRFKRDRHSYVVYTAIGRGWRDKAGIAVEIDHKLQVNLACKKPVLSELGPDYFDQAGLVKDQVGFDLP